MTVKQGATSGILKPPRKPASKMGVNVRGLKKAVAAAAEVNKKKKPSAQKARKKAISQSQAPKIPGTKLRQ